ncbi:MAG TPA: biopolymer transporter ExbD [Xanthomonadaceae bacterium]|nr:biopolymer transporter ExbD [Xanthomonadaceae bacterium]
MRLTPTRRIDEPEINLTSLIDVVFTLIIFFVVTTTFDDRTALEVRLPEASPEPATAPTDPLVIAIDREGRYIVGGAELPSPDADELRKAIARVAGADRTRAVVLRADARTPHQSVVTAMDVLGQLGFERLSIATTSTQAAPE